MTAHVHAALMAEYAKDAAETDRPWERWEYRVSADRDWTECETYSAWYETWEYRRKSQPLECWVNVYRRDGDPYCCAFDSEYEASKDALMAPKLGAGFKTVRTAVHMREVIE